MTPPMSDILKTNITKFLDGLLPSEQGGYAHYGELQDNDKMVTVTVTVTVTVLLNLCLFQALLHNEPNWFQTIFVQ